MTTNTHTRKRSGRLGVLAAFGIASLALVAASPASAIYRTYEPSYSETSTYERPAYTTKEPVDENGKRYCRLANADGGENWVKHGDTITVTIPGDGKVTGPTTLTYKCNDGKWDPVSSEPAASDYHYTADEAYVDDSGKLVLVNPRVDYSYSTSDGYYAQP